MSGQSKFTKNDFLKYSYYLKEEIGLDFKEIKFALIEKRLRKKLEEKKISPDDYLELVKSDSSEKSYFIDILTTHKTDWFRENVHYKFISNYIKNSKQSSYQFWSAASSTGEEAYSLAITLMEEGVDISKYKILGTDISEKCIRACEDGLYCKEAVSSQVPTACVEKYFIETDDEKIKKKLKINHNLINNVQFKKFNLLSSGHKGNIKFDVIFLRNVMIYFDQETKVKVMKNILNYLNDGGYLIIGLSETIYRVNEFNLVKISDSIYKHDKSIQKKS